jgi:hypothetical protein
MLGENATAGVRWREVEPASLITSRMFLHLWNTDVLLDPARDGFNSDEHKVAATNGS